MNNYRSPSREEHVYVSLSDFTKAEICKEYEYRSGLASTSYEIDEEDSPVTVAGDELRRIRTLLLCGQSQVALDAMQALIRDALGTAL